MSTENVTAFERIAIQMEYVVPLIRDLERILGKDAVKAALEERLRLLTEDAKQGPPGPGDLTRLAAGLEMYAAGDALEYEVLAADAERYDFDVKRCRYAKMMGELGARDIGPLLICRLDFPEAERDGVELTRTQTCMQGASHCDFRYRKKARTDAGAG